jgi:hypothetical protein
VKSLKVVCSVFVLTMLVFACPSSISCPADHGEMHKIGDEYMGAIHYAIYEHQTSAGVTHQVTFRCEN